jgi:signal transduction histidine kinase
MAGASCTPRQVIKHQKVRLKRLVQDVVALHAPLMKKGVKLVDRLPSDLPTITGDHERIVQIFHNLIGTPTPLVPAAPPRPAPSFMVSWP